MALHSTPFISICIPAYQRTHYLKRLLQSISEQSYTHFEVIISDDSRDDSVQQLVRLFEAKFPLHYYKNETALGTPANWNFATGKAGGEWIKLMHDDDWFATPNALQIFADATKKGRKFIVSGYNNIDDKNAVLRKPLLTSFRKKMLIRTPMVLLSENYIGQPSVTMVHCSVKAIYDERMKWRVDIDYYMQVLLSERNFTYITNVIINLGIGNTQVTHSCLNVPSVELPEGWLLLEKFGTKSLKNILVYDAWWRMIRNTGTRGKEMLYQYAPTWPKVIESMAERQNKVEPSRLQQGVFSKLYMLMSYVTAVSSGYFKPDNKTPF